MLIEQTLDKLNAMKIGAMADACRQQMQTDEAAALGFECCRSRVCERFSTSVDPKMLRSPTAPSRLSVRVCSPPSRRCAALRPRFAGLKAWTAAPRTLVQTASCTTAPQSRPLHVVVDELSRLTQFLAPVDIEERLGLLVDAEWTAREQRKLQRRLNTAKLRYPATLEAVDFTHFTHPRRLNRQQVLTLGTCAWIAERHNLLLIGPTGIGKSFLSCAFVERACRRGFTARYVRMPRLLHELAVGRGDGSYTRMLTRLAKLDLLAVDDWMLAPLRDAERRDLTEVIEDRAERASTLIASQLPVTDWHAVIGDPNQADAICDRLLHDAHRIELKGRSLRRTHDAPKTRTPKTT